MTTATTTTDLNLRDKPTTSGSTVIAVIPAKAVVTVTGPKQGNWYPVTYGYMYGYVSAAFLIGITTTTELPPPPPPPPVEPAALWTPDCRRILYDFAIDLYGVPYKWGASGAVDGGAADDCSGYTTIMLKSQDVLKDSERLSAQSQYNRWKANTVARAAVDLGDLIFYGGSTSSIGHVMMALNDTLCIGSQGGGESTKTLADAIATDGRVQTRIIDYRADRVAIVRPPWPFHNQ